MNSQTFSNGKCNFLKWQPSRMCIINWYVREFLPTRGKINDSDVLDKGKEAKTDREGETGKRKRKSTSEIK